MKSDLDHQQLAVEWLRALRGKRSQRALSRRLGYRSNVAYRWESGVCSPTARTVWRAMTTLGWPLAEGLARFTGTASSEVNSLDLTTTAGVAGFLQHLRQRTPMTALARVTGHSRFSIARWLKGTAEPRWPEFLQLVDACSLRLVDFATAFVEASELPSIAQTAVRMAASSEAAYDKPWSHAVLRMLEVSAYRALVRHRRGFIAEQLGIAEEEEVHCLRLLCQAGQAHWDGARYRVTEQEVIDVGGDPARSLALKATWGREAISAMEAGAPGSYALNLMAVSEADFTKLKALQEAYFREMRAIVISSAPDERVVLYSAQLLALDRKPTAGSPV